MPELIVPIIGLGLAVATVKNAAGGWMLFGLAAGFAAGASIPFSLPGDTALVAMFIAIGLLLICSDIWVRRLLMPVSLFVGFLLGHDSTLPAPLDPLVISLHGALLVLVVGAAAVTRRYYRPWFAIPRRIGGSWSLAAGSLLLALVLRTPGIPIRATGELTPPPHDPNQPHIHGPNGEIIYLPSSRKEETNPIPKKRGILGTASGNQIDP